MTTYEHTQRLAEQERRLLSRLERGDEGLMLGWFANAMMAMHDYQAAKLRKQGIPDPAAYVAAFEGVVAALRKARSQIVAHLLDDMDAQHATNEVAYIDAALAAARQARGGE